MKLTHRERILHEWLFHKIYKCMKLTLWKFHITKEITTSVKFSFIIFLGFYSLKSGDNFNNSRVKGSIWVLGANEQVIRNMWSYTFLCHEFKPLDNDDII